MSTRWVGWRDPETSSSQRSAAKAPTSRRRFAPSTTSRERRSRRSRRIYASPKVSDYWRRVITRQRVRLWAVEREVMMGWRAHVKPDADPARQDRLWRWVRETVDYRVRARGL